jgi:hypothetical protein
MYERLYAKKTELIARVYDHAQKLYKTGFRLLSLGWSDGNTFLPVNSCLMSTENKKNRLVEASTVDKRTAGYKRRQLAQMKATKVVLHLLEMAKNAGIPATHVLFDTWFCFPASLVEIKKMGFDVVAMAKKSRNFKYIYNGISQPLTAIYKQSKKRRGRSKYLLSVEVTVEKDGESIPARIVYVKNRSKRKDYLALITTDMSLTEEEIIQLYGRRWSIEVFFKVCKSYLKLNGECRSMSYDAMTAHVAIVFIRFMMLSVENREQTDDRTIGDLFFLVSDELADITFVQSFNLLMQVFLKTIADKLTLTEESIKQFVDEFMAALPKKQVHILKKVA